MMINHLFGKILRRVRCYYTDAIHWHLSRLIDVSDMFQLNSMLQEEYYMQELRV